MAAPHLPIRPYYDSEAERSRWLRGIFSRTAGDYDRVERLLGMGTGSWYRRRALLRAGLSPSAAVEGQQRGMPLLQLERFTFNFVAAGFAALSATLVLGLMTSGPWRFEHKTVFALLAWLVFAALLAGRHWRGWRGRRATRWLYTGAVLLLLAYAGSRFVLEVLLAR